MTEGTSYCFECKRLLVEIDNRGQHLWGCLTCNIWWSLTGGGAVKLSEEDLTLCGESETVPTETDAANTVSYTNR
jgi:hypothetical protein